MALLRPSPRPARVRLVLGILVFAVAGALLIRELLSGGAEPVNVFALGLVTAVGAFVAAMVVGRQES